MCDSSFETFRGTIRGESLKGAENRESEGLWASLVERVGTFVGALVDAFAGSNFAVLV